MVDEVVSQEFVSRLRAFIARRIRIDADTDEIMQDTLLKFVQHRESIVDASGPAWMFTVARRAIADRMRRRLTETVGLPEGHPSEDAVLVGSAMSELANCVEPLLAQLEPADRMILERVDLRGESQAEIADGLGLPRSKIKARVQRARERFRDRLTNCCSLVTDTRGIPVDYAPRSPSGCECSPSSTT